MSSPISSNRQFPATAQRFIAICALAFWQGGLTFHAVVVVPVANSILTGGEQGFVTQEVTNWMNRLGVPVVAILAIYARQLRSRIFWLACAVLGLTLAALFVIHARMDAQLDPASFAIIDRAKFSLLHDLYLVVITIQWCAGLAAGWLLLSRQTVSEAASMT
ncbi:MAG TPA: hypothetical protein VGN12_13000 [Pirellulales bacterium]|jgi:hypothetical protein